MAKYVYYDEVSFYNYRGAFFIYLTFTVAKNATVRYTENFVNIIDTLRVVRSKLHYTHVLIKYIP